MRLLLAVFVAALTLGTLEASAAAGKWKCLGGHYVCGPMKSAASATTKKKSYSYKKKSYKKKKYSKKTYKKKKSYKKVASKNRRSRRNRKSRGGRGTLYGKASYYWQPQAVASGGRFNPNAMTAAHKSLPFGTRVRVTNLRNGRSVIVRINDRGPYIKGRIIDLSRAAAGRIRMRGAGVVSVKVTVLGRS